MDLSPFKQTRWKIITAVFLVLLFGLLFYGDEAEYTEKPPQNTQVLAKKPRAKHDDLRILGSEAARSAKKIGNPFSFEHEGKDEIPSSQKSDKEDIGKTLQTEKPVAPNPSSVTNSATINKQPEPSKTGSIDALRLKGVIKSDTKVIAIISDGKEEAILMEGDAFCGGKILAIHENTVEIEFPNGIFNLRMPRI